MRPALAISVFLFVAGCGAGGASPEVAPGRADQGDWVHFFDRTTPTQRIRYAYDRASVHRDGDHLVGRWKLEATGTTPLSLYTFRLDCRLGTFTELGTVLTDDHGQSRTAPQSELWVDHAIDPNTSMASYRQMFCG